MSGKCSAIADQALKIVTLLVDLIPADLSFEEADRILGSSERWIPEVRKRVFCGDIEQAERDSELRRERIEALRSLLDMSLRELDLPARVINACEMHRGFGIRAEWTEEASIRTVRDLVRIPGRKLLAVRNLGRGSIAEIEKVLGDLGLSLGMDV